MRAETDAPWTDGTGSLQGLQMSRSAGSRFDDGAIPQLRLLSSAPYVARLLGTALAGGPYAGLIRGDGRVDVRAVTVLRGHPGSRWTLRIDIHRGIRDAAIFAKVYARDRTDIASTLATLRSRGLGAGRSMQVSAPLAYLPTLHLLLLEEAPGEPARTALRGGEKGIGSRVATWLAAFHAAAPPVTMAIPERHPLKRARRWAQALGSNVPVLERSTRRLLAALAEAAPAWTELPRLVHGDFNASHVFLGAETTTVIDWDAWSVGDCAEDAGRFSASLRHLAVRRSRCGGPSAGSACEFAEGFQAAVPESRRNFSFYEALACLRTAARLSAARTSQARHDAELVVAIGQRALGAYRSDATHEPRAIRRS